MRPLLLVALLAAVSGAHGTSVTAGRATTLTDAVVTGGKGTDVVLITPHRATCSGLHTYLRRNVLAGGAAAVTIAEVRADGLRRGPQVATVALGRASLLHADVSLTSFSRRAGSIWRGTALVQSTAVGGLHYSLRARFAARWCGALS